MLPLLSLGLTAVQAIGGMGAARRASNAQVDSSKRQIDFARDVRDQNTGLAGDNLTAQRGLSQGVLGDQRGIAGDTRNALMGVASDYQRAAGGSSREALGQQLEYFRPFAHQGRRANDALGVEFGLQQGQSGFRETPGYQFRMREGLDAVEGSAAAAGGQAANANGKPEYEALWGRY
jgi:hypothetical protein